MGLLAITALLAWKSKIDIKSPIEILSIITITIALFFYLHDLALLVFKKLVSEENKHQFTAYAVFLILLISFIAYISASSLGIPDGISGTIGWTIAFSLGSAMGRATKSPIANQSLE